MDTHADVSTKNQSIFSVGPIRELSCERFGYYTLAVAGHVELLAFHHCADRFQIALRNRRGEFLLKESPREFCEADTEFSGTPLGSRMHLIGKSDHSPHSDIIASLSRYLFSGATVRLMPTADGTEFDETVAYVALRRVQNRYADIVTRRRWPELAEIMRPDCVVTVDLVDRAIDFDGPVAIGDFIAAQIEQFDFFEFVILNTVMEIDADAGRASARMYIQEARQSVDSGERCDTFGVYHDYFVRDDTSRWWFARRRYKSYARTNPAGSGADLTVFELPEIPL